MVSVCVPALKPARSTVPPLDGWQLMALSRHQVPTTTLGGKGKMDTGLASMKTAAVSSAQNETRLPATEGAPKLKVSVKITVGGPSRVVLAGEMSDAPQPVWA